jgi:putative colanic acid biosynthesis UDP-glucose lipid carrier transferase
MAFTALALKTQFSGSVIFRQTRPGLKGKPFTIYKFRTMREPAATTQGDRTAQMSSRVTPVSRLIRRYGLDELPQLVNVLKGDMSLVGPRPVQWVASDPEMYAMRPGITGLRQITVRNSVCRAAQEEIELHYIRNWGLRRDFAILAKTIPAVIRGKNYLEPDNPTYLRNIPD